MADYHVDEVNGSWANNGSDANSRMKSLWLATKLATSGDTIYLYNTTLVAPHRHTDPIPAGVTVKSAVSGSHAVVTNTVSLSDNDIVPCMKVNSTLPKESYFALSAADDDTSGEWVAQINGTPTWDTGTKAYGAGSVKLDANEYLRSAQMYYHGRKLRLRFLVKFENAASVLKVRLDATPYAGTANSDRHAYKWQNNAWDAQGVDYDMYDISGDRADGTNFGTAGFVEIVSPTFSLYDDMDASTGSGTTNYIRIVASGGGMWVQHAILEEVIEWKLVSQSLNIWVCPWDQSSSLDTTSYGGLRTIPGYFYAAATSDLNDHASYTLGEGYNEEATVTAATGIANDGAGEAVFTTQAAHGFATDDYVFMSNVWDYDDHAALRETVWKVEVLTTTTFKAINPDTGAYYDASGLTLADNLRVMKVSAIPLEGGNGTQNNSKWISFCCEPGKTPADYDIQMPMRNAGIEFGGAGATVIDVKTVLAQYGVVAHATGDNTLYNFVERNSMNLAAVSEGSGSLTFYGFDSSQPVKSASVKEYGGGVRAGTSGGASGSITIHGGRVQNAGDDSYQAIGTGNIALKGCISVDAFGEDIELTLTGAAGSLTVDGFSGNGRYLDISDELQAYTVSLSNMATSQFSLNGKTRAAPSYTIASTVFTAGAGTDGTAGGQEANVQTGATLGYTSATDLTPTVLSDLVGAGTKWWTGANPTSASGEPYSDFDTDAGGIQSTLSPFHPSNL